MKTREIKELEDKTLPELRQLLAELKGKLAKAALEIKLKKTKNVRAAKFLRSDIARVLTILCQKS